MNNLTAYLQHGKAGEPMRTESLPVEWDTKPKSVRSVSGRNGRWPSVFKVNYLGRWHRVYSDTTIGGSMLYIESKGCKIRVTVKEV